MKTQQRSIRFALPTVPGQSNAARRREETILNNPPRFESDGKRLADLLKRLACEAMDAVTECPSHVIGAHVARMEAVAKVAQLVMACGFVPGSETLRSDHQLTTPRTLADHVEAMAITKQTHRAPCWLTTRDTALEQINRKLDVLAGLLAHSPALRAILLGEEDER